MLNGFSGFSLADISNINFQYGTALSEGHFVGKPEVLPPIRVPEPATLAMLGLGLFGIGAMRRRKA